MLLNGEVDAAFFVSTHLASHVINLIDSKSVKLMGLERAEAYALLYHYLFLLKVPEGVIDLEANIPSRDLTLIAPTTELVARPDLHPALINLLLEAAKEVHKFGGDFWDKTRALFFHNARAQFNGQPRPKRQMDLKNGGG